jgi:hypothetical protein
MRLAHVLRWGRLRSALSELLRLRHDSLPASRDLGILLRSYGKPGVNLYMWMILGREFGAAVKSSFYSFGRKRP